MYLVFAGLLALVLYLMLAGEREGFGIVGPYRRYKRDMRISTQKIAKDIKQRVKSILRNF